MRKIMIAALVAAGVTASPALAQATQQNGLVNVNVADVLNDLDLLNGSLNNNTVQVPIGVAAAVCNIDANVIAKQRKAGTYQPCSAQTTNQALKQAAKRQANPKK